MKAVSTALEDRDQTFAANLVTTLSPHALNEARFQYTRSRLGAGLVEVTRAIRPAQAAGASWIAQEAEERVFGRVRNALRLGTYQLAFTRVPDHAAVSQTVGLVSARERG